MQQANQIRFSGSALVMGLCGTSFGHAPPGELFFAVQFPDNLVPTMDGDLSDWTSCRLIRTRSATTASIRQWPDIQPVGRARSMSATLTFATSSAGTTTRISSTT